jgi:hypothetical protein
MGMYFCDSCNSLKDDDYEPCTESKKDGLGLLCEECSQEEEEEEE